MEYQGLDVWEVFECMSWNLGKQVYSEDVNLGIFGGWLNLENKSMWTVKRKEGNCDEEASIMIEGGSLGKTKL